MKCLSVSLLSIPRYLSMLPKKQRLSKNSFEKVLKKGKIFSSEHFTLRILFSAEKKDVLPSFAVISPKKIFKTAVARNSARRKVYSALASCPSVNSPRNVSALFFYRNAPKKKTFIDLQKEIGALLSKAGL